MYLGYKDLDNGQVVFVVCLEGTKADIKRVKQNSSYYSDPKFKSISKSQLLRPSSCQNILGVKKVKVKDKSGKEIVIRIREDEYLNYNVKVYLEEKIKEWEGVKELYIKSDNYDHYISHMGSGDTYILYNKIPNTKKKEKIFTVKVPNDLYKPMTAEIAPGWASEEELKVELWTLNGLKELIDYIKKGEK